MQQPAATEKFDLEWESGIDRIFKLNGFGRQLALKSIAEHIFHNSNDYFEKLGSIRNYYKHIEPKILEYHLSNPRRWYSSYPVDWNLVFSPIERMAWETIRSTGGMPLYPQYPVLNYFVDFANPGYKVCLELDGEKYHNPERDRIRDDKIKAAGWTIYRITGKEMCSPLVSIYQIDEHVQEHGLYDDSIFAIRNWLLHRGDGVIAALIDYYTRYSKGDLSYRNEFDMWRINYSYETLEKHRQ